MLILIMGNKREIQKKYDNTRDDAIHNEKRNLYYKKKMKQKLAYIGEIPNDDVKKDLYISQVVDLPGGKTGQPLSTVFKVSKI